MTDSTGNQPKNRSDSAPRERSGRRESSRGRNQGHRYRGNGGSSQGGRGGKGHKREQSNGPPQSKGKQRRREHFDDHKPKHNPADLRSSNRPDRGRSPNIDDDVTGRELNKSVQRELGTMDEQNRTWVQKHLVMAGRLLDEDPHLAFEHALAASRRGGRLGVVREAAGMTAYAAGKFSDALREFRTYRRISGDNAHLPEMVDAERALGRSAKALEMAREAQLEKLPETSQVELAIVVAGIHLDHNDPQAAVAALEIPQLNPRRGFSYSPRLFSAYAEALDAAGRSDESRKWSKLAARAERALGVAVEPEPEIFDLGADADQSSTSARAKDVLPPVQQQQNRVQGGDE